MKLIVKTDEGEASYNSILNLNTVTIQKYIPYLPKYKLNFYDNDKNKWVDDVIAYAYKTEG